MISLIYVCVGINLGARITGFLHKDYQYTIANLFAVIFNLVLLIINRK